MKNTNYYSIKLLKKISIASILFAIPFGLSAQNEGTYKTFINNTGLVVYEVQKAMKSNNVTNVKGGLANLMRMQINAVELYDKKEYALAASLSNSCREEAIKLLAKLNGSAEEFYGISDEEKKLFAAIDPSFINKLAKQKNASISSKDEDYAVDAQLTQKIMIQ